MSYSWKKTFKKFISSGIVVVLAGILSVYAENPYVFAIVPAFEAIKNAVKHWNDL